MTPMEVLDQIDALGNSKPTVESLEELKLLVATHARSLVADARELARIKEAGGPSEAERAFVNELTDWEQEDESGDRLTPSELGRIASKHYSNVAKRDIDHQAAELERYRAATEKIRADFHDFQNSPYRGEWDQWAYRYGDVFRFVASLPRSSEYPVITTPGDVGLEPWPLPPPPKGSE